MEKQTIIHMGSIEKDTLNDLIKHALSSKPAQKTDPCIMRGKGLIRRIEENAQPQDTSLSEDALENFRKSICASEKKENPQAK